MINTNKLKYGLCVHVHHSLFILLFVGIRGTMAGRNASSTNFTGLLTDPVINMHVHPSGTKTGLLKKRALFFSRKITELFLSFFFST